MYPARHLASTSANRSLPPMGLRLRLPANVPVSGFPPQARVILRALKRYGMIVADTASAGTSPGFRTLAGETTNCTRSIA